MPNSTSGASTSSADACISIVHSLMCHRQGGESEAFAKRAIECLVKKLKDKPDELDGLIQAITLSGSHPSKCATIPRTLDGRLQVAGKKVFPHVIYARIWRWADIQKSELKQVSYCQFAFDLKLDNVCVNPYHYERVISPGIDLSLSSLGLAHGNRDDDHYDYNSPNSPASMAHPPPYFSQPELHPMFTQSSMGGPNSDSRQPSCNLVHHAHSQPFEQKPQISGLFASEGIFGGGGGGHSMMGPPPPSYWASQPGSGMGELQDPNGAFLREEQRMWDDRRYEMAITGQTPVEYWCNIAYFELDQQVGETFKVKSAYRTITVDCFSNPGHSNRFCLGPLTNVHRTEASERTRLHIGKGISLENKEDGSIWLRVLGTGEEDNYSVFVESYHLDREANRNPGDAVHKIHPNAPMLKIFDLKQCYVQMLHQLERTQMHAQAQVAAVTGGQGRPKALSPVPPVNMGASAGIGADDLRKFCVLRLSFLKGWGPDYKRKSIKETPCWIEIHINRALQLLDEVLRNAPSNEPRMMTEYS